MSTRICRGQILSFPFWRAWIWPTDGSKLSFDLAIAVPVHRYQCERMGPVEAARRCGPIWHQIRVTPARAARGQPRIRSGQRPAAPPPHATLQTSANIAQTTTTSHTRHQQTSHKPPPHHTPANIAQTAATPHTSKHRTNRPRMSISGEQTH